MTILPLAFHSYKKLKSFLFPSNHFKMVEHLSDHLLDDIGMYRKDGQVINLNATHSAPSTVLATKRSKEQLITGYLKDSSG
ncbi:MAG: hypothetical protein OFPII_21350 [Osedax symbiont Rs1]|nr:MAG: hypothetical protein OFPII_21350 [Osedax symbiont Rs1]